MKTRIIATIVSVFLVVFILCAVVSLKNDDISDIHLIGGVGKAQKVLKGNNEAVLFEHQGRGCLTHFWFGGNFQGVENTRIRYYIDGEKIPSIDMKLYLGHGIGFNDNHAPWGTQYIGKIGKKNGVYNNYRIPFGESIRVTAQRWQKAEDDPMIWYIIRGVENGRVHLGGRELPETARLKLYKVVDHAAKALEEFDLFDIDGQGALFQVTIAGQQTTESDLYFLEACMRAYIDQSDKPIMLSSGLEDYFLGTYYFDSGLFYTDMSGLTHFSEKNRRFSAYRFHDQDPVFFQDGMRLTSRCGETIHGTNIGKPAYTNPPKAIYTTYSWVYEW